MDLGQIAIRLFGGVTAALVAMIALGFISHYAELLFVLPEGTHLTGNVVTWCVVAGLAFIFGFKSMKK